MDNSVDTETPQVVVDNQVEGNTPEKPAKKQGNARNYIIIAVAILIVGVLGVLAGVYYASSSGDDATKEPEVVVDQEDSEPMASVSETEGVAWRIVDGRRIEILSGDEVGQGDGIETEEDGRIVVNLKDGSTVRIGENTSLVVASLSESNVTLVLDSGEVFNVVEESQGREFIVEAGEITVKALGTAFSVENYDEVKVGVYESKVEVTDGEEKLEVEESFEYDRQSGETLALSAQNIGEDNFLQWSLQQEIQRINNETVAEIVASIGEDASKEDFKEAVAETGVDKKELMKEAFLNTTSGSVSSITLSGEKTSDGAVSLSWTTDGLAENGFKVVWSQTPGKAYPGDKRTHKPLFGYAKTLGPMKSGTWYYRVCEWTGDTCGVYSNEITLAF